MRQIIKTTIAAFALVTLACLQPAAAVDTAQAVRFLEDLQAKAAAQLGAAAISAEEKQRNFRDLFREKFDVAAIGRFVIGRYWRSASEADQDAFLEVFEDAMAQRFLGVLAKNASVTFQIQSVTEDSASDDMALIDTRIDSNAAEAYRVTWRVREADGRFKILDVVAEGISMAITLRSEYASVLNRNRGQLPLLTQALRDRLDAASSRVD